VSSNSNESEVAELKKKKKKKRRATIKNKKLDKSLIKLTKVSRKSQVYGSQASLPDGPSTDKKSKTESLHSDFKKPDFLPPLSSTMKSLKPRRTEEEEQRIMQEKLSIQVQMNQSRELVGQRYNANIRDLRERPMVINTMYTQYEILADCGKETNFILSQDEE